MTTRGGIPILLTNVYTSAAEFSIKIQAKFVSASANIRKTLSQRKEMTAGILLFRKRNKIATLYLQREITSNEDVLLGTTSNNPIRVDARTISKKVFSNILVVAPKDKLTKHKFPLGADIDKSEALLKDLFLDENGNPKDNEVYGAARVPVGALLPYGAEVKTGTVTQATYTAYEQFDDTEYLSDWTELVSHHSPETQELFLNNDELKKYRPTMPRGHQWTSDPWVKLESVDEDDDELEEEVKRLASECEVIIKANSNRDDASSAGPVPEIDLLSPRAAVSPEKSNTITDEDRINARALAFGMRYDPESDELTPPVTSEFFNTVSKTSKGWAQRDITQSSLTSIEEQMGESEHFLLRSVDMPKMEKLVLANISHCKWDQEQLSSMDQAIGKGIMVNMMLADSASTARVKAEKGNRAEVEEILMEHHSKRAELDKTFTPAGELHSANGLITLLANLLCVNFFWFSFDPENDPTPPSIVSYIMMVARLLTTRDGKKWIKNNPAKRHKFLLYVVNQLVAVSSALARASLDVVVTTRIISKQWNQIPTKHYKLADKILKATLSEMAEIFLGSRDVPNTALWNNSKSKEKAESAEVNKLVGAVKDKLGNQLKREPSTPRPGRDDSRAEPKRYKKSLTGDKKGYVTNSGPNRFQVPKTLHNEDFKLCKSFALDGVECHFGDRCQFSHLWLDELDESRARCLVKAVDADQHLNFVNVSDELLKKLRA